MEVLSSRKSEQGFSLIELLLVCLILGILATIAIPLFLDQKQKATDSNAKALVRTGVAALETHATYRDTYNATRAELLDIAPELDDATAWSASGTRTSFTMSVTTRDGRVFTVERTSTGLTRTCTPVGGGCYSGNSW